MPLPVLTPSPSCTDDPNDAYGPSPGWIERINYLQSGSIIATSYLAVAGSFVDVTLAWKSTVTGNMAVPAGLNVTVEVGFKDPSNPTSAGNAWYHPADVGSGVTVSSGLDTQRVTLPYVLPFWEVYVTMNTQWNVSGYPSDYSLIEIYDLSFEGQGPQGWSLGFLGW